MVEDIKRYEIYLVKLNPTVGSKIQKARLVKKLGSVEKSISKEISTILVEMFKV